MSDYDAVWFGVFVSSCFWVPIGVFSHFVWRLLSHDDEDYNEKR